MPGKDENHAGAENTEKQKLSAPLRARMWKYRMISVIVCALAVWIASKGNWNKIPLSVATVVLIIGVADLDAGIAG